MRLMTMTSLYTFETPALHQTLTFTQKSCNKKNFDLSKENRIS